MMSPFQKTFSSFTLYTYINRYYGDLIEYIVNPRVGGVKYYNKYSLKNPVTRADDIFNFGIAGRRLIWYYIMYKNTTAWATAVLLWVPGRRDGFWRSIVLRVPRSRPSRTHIFFSLYEFFFYIWLHAFAISNFFTDHRSQGVFFISLPIFRDSHFTFYNTKTLYHSKWIPTLLFVIGLIDSWKLCFKYFIFWIWF